MSVGGTTFEAAQFHFHTASETTIRGMQYPLEMHVVHVTPGANAVSYTHLTLPTILRV